MCEKPLSFDISIKCLINVSCYYLYLSAGSIFSENCNPVDSPLNKRGLRM